MENQEVDGETAFFPFPLQFWKERLAFARAWGTEVRILHHTRCEAWWVGVWEGAL